MANNGDEEVPTDCIAPTPDVFGYFLFASPSERFKHRRFTVDACMSYVLVFFALAMQGIMLFCVYDKVVSNNTDWRNGIVNTGQDWNLIAPQHQKCNDGQSLCSKDANGTYTCSPPTLQLIGRWDELDLDKDGVWTRDEVLKARADLKCKYAVDPLEVFNVVVSLIKERQDHIWIHPDVKNGKALNKHYFTYIMGDIAICGYRNEDMCGNLIKRGVFDAPLKNANVPRVGSSINSAVDFCHDLLAPRGLCERVLPSTYGTWKIESVQECEEPKFRKFVHKDPKGYTVKSLLEVHYKAPMRYEVAQTPIFMMYKGCIILLWFVLVIAQLREVTKTMTWVFQLPFRIDGLSPREMEVAGLDPNSCALTKAAIEGMSGRHRVVLGLVTFFRIGMLGVLLYVGLNFLGRQTDYIGLLLDGVALLFIVEVAVILYDRVLRQEVRTHWEEREPIELVKVGLKGLTSRPDVTDMLWFCFIVCLAVLFLLFYTRYTVLPVYDALQCTCASEGPNCREAHVFSSSFWDQYWSKDVPASINGIMALKADWQTAASRAVNLLKYRKHVHHQLG
jgi:hypothetical protein